MTKRRSGGGTRSGWSPTMELTGRTLEGRQVKCITADEGHVWMPSYDELPPVVRRRLANSPFNICAACLTIEVGRARSTGVEAYFAAIDAIERKLDGTT